MAAVNRFDNVHLVGGIHLNYAKTLAEFCVNCAAILDYIGFEVPFEMLTVDSRQFLR